MDLELIRCFEAIAAELHFGRAARRLDVLPSTLSRNIRTLEAELGLRLLDRTTRNVALTPAGQVMIHESRRLLATAEELVERVRDAAGSDRVFRVGAMDSAATGLLPRLIHDFREIQPNIELTLTEDKSAKLLPKLLTGALDIAFVRPPDVPNQAIHFEFLLNEAAVVAMPAQHTLAKRDSVRIEDLANVPLIVPSPRNRPHSHALTTSLLVRAGVAPGTVQQAEEKQTIINMVAADIGAAIVPYWFSRLSLDGVVYRPLVDESGAKVGELPLAAAWLTGTEDPSRDALLALLRRNLRKYAD